MAVKTPEYWKEYDLIEETTAYGNKVMIPEILQHVWNAEKIYQKLTIQNGDTPQDGLKYRLTEVYTNPIAKDLVLTYWERYQKQS